MVPQSLSMGANHLILPNGESGGNTLFYSDVLAFSDMCHLLPMCRWTSYIYFPLGSFTSAAVSPGISPKLKQEL